MATNKPRFTISVSDKMFDEIEDFRFLNRFQNRNEALEALLQMGLDAIKQKGDGKALKKKED